LQERELISPVSNSGKVVSFKHEELDKDWWKRKMKATGFWGLAQTRYSFLDPGLLATFVERWHGDNNTFHLPCGEMIVTLDDVRCLLSLPIQGRPLNHTGLPNKKDGVTWMKDLLGTKKREVEDEVRKTKGAHIIFVFLKKLITKHLERMRTAQRDKDPDGEDKAKVLVMMAYLMLLVETTIFSNKAKNYIDLT
jgi:hypothetical protein